MVRLVEEHRDAYGVESICAQLPIAPATYYKASSSRARRRAASRVRTAGCEPRGGHPAGLGRQLPGVRAAESRPAEFTACANGNIIVRIMNLWNCRFSVTRSRKFRNP